MPKAYSYLRFSSAKQEQGDSVRRQTEAAERYIQENTHLNLELSDDQRFSDLGRSAYRGDEQAALKGFLQRVRDGYIEEGSYLLIENFDRLSRQSAYNAQPVFRTLIDAGIIIVTLQDGARFDLETLNKPEGTFLLLQSMMAMHRANEESVAKAKRMKAAWERKRRDATEKNTQLTKKVPFWITKDRELIPDKVALVKKIFKLASQGFGETRIARELNAEGIPSAEGGRWNESSISRLVRSPTVVGSLVGNDGVHIRDGYYPSAIDMRSWLIAQRFATTSRTSKERSGRTPHLLAGLTFCRCGKPLVRGARTGRVRKDGTRNKWEYLICSDARVAAGRCKFVGIPYGRASQAVIAALEGIHHALEEVGDGSEGVERAQTEHRQALEVAEAAYETWMVTKGRFAKEKLRQAEEALDVAKEKLGEIVQQSGKTGYRVTLDALQRISKGEVTNAVLRQILNRITIDVKTNELLLESYGGLRLNAPLRDELVDIVDTTNDEYESKSKRTSDGSRK